MRWFCLQLTSRCSSISTSSFFPLKSLSLFPPFPLCVTLVLPSDISFPTSLPSYLFPYVFPFPPYLALPSLSTCFLYFLSINTRPLLLPTSSALPPSLSITHKWCVHIVSSNQATVTCPVHKSPAEDCPGSSWLTVMCSVSMCYNGGVSEVPIVCGNKFQIDGS